MISRVLYILLRKGMRQLYLYPRIRDFREDRDLSQKFVASVIGTTQQYYSEYERGIREIPLHSFIKLAKFYGVSLDQLAENATLTLTDR